MPAAKPKVPKVRCPWSHGGNELYVHYHDTEWGVPAWDDRTQFEFLILEGAQAGLSWSTILNKREGYREAFAGFDPERIARFGKRDLTRLMKNPGIVRNRLKIESTISNARAYLDFQSQHGGFVRGALRIRLVIDDLRAVAELPRPRDARRIRASGNDGDALGVEPLQNRWTQHKQVPATSAESDALSKDLKQRGFRFVGSTIIYAHMQATGMVNDHVTGCFRYKECKALGKKGN